MTCNRDHGRRGRPRPVLAVLVALLLTVVAVGAAAVGGASAAEIIEQTDEEIVLRVRLKNFELLDLEAGGVRYKTISGSDFVSLSETGQPDLPGYSYLLAVPEGGSARLVSVEASFEMCSTSTWWRIRSATACAPSSLVPGSITANSSPP